MFFRDGKLALAYALKSLFLLMNSWNKWHSNKTNKECLKPCYEFWCEYWNTINIQTFFFVHSLKENSSVKFRTEEGIKFVLLFLFILEVNSSRTRVYEVYLFREVIGLNAQFQRCKLNLALWKRFSLLTCQNSVQWPWLRHLSSVWSMDQIASSNKLSP